MNKLDGEISWKLNQTALNFAGKSINLIKMYLLSTLRQEFPYMLEIYG